MAIFTKAIAGTAIAGTITLGAMTMWTGGDTLDNAANKITQQAEKLQIFASNETKLVDKVNGMKAQVETLKTEKANLEGQLADALAGNNADAAKIADLEQQIADKDAEIATLNGEVESLTADLNNSASNTAEITQRIADLEAQLAEANSDAEALQTQMDTMEPTPEPDQAAVDAALAEPTTEGDTTTEPTPEPQPDPSAYDQELMMASGLPQYISGTDLGFDSAFENTDQLVMTNGGYKSGTFQVEGQDPITIVGEGTTNVGSKAALDGKIATITQNGKTTTYLLSNK